MISGGLIRIEEAFSMLTPMEKKAASYILDHPQQVVSLSVQKLAKLAKVSEATLVRLSRSLNCKGFTELKLKIAADLAQSISHDDAYQEIKFDGTTAEVIRSISHNNMKSIQDTLMIISEEEIEQAIHAMQRARKVAVFGIGASAVIAEDFRQKLARINRWCEAGYSFDAQAVIAANLQEGDVALAISYSGQTEDTIQALQLAKHSGATLITLTKFGNNPLAEIADIRLYVSSLEKSIRSGAMASRIAQLNMIDILYTGIAAGNLEESILMLEKTRKAVRGSKRIR